IGTATAIAGDQITVLSGSSTSILLYGNKESKIWRGKITNSLAVVQPGDEVSIRYRRGPDGRPVILDLWANIDHVHGIITGIGSSAFEVDENPDADPHSAYRRGKRQIAFEPDTKFQDSAREDLRVGRHVDVIGLKTSADRVVASRIIVYEGKRPVRLK